MCTVKQHFYDKSIMFGGVGEGGGKELSVIAKFRILKALAG